jgi:hypothetical protein
VFDTVRARADTRREAAPIMTRRRELVFACVASLIGLALVLTLAEVVFRFLPVMSAMRPGPVTASSPIYHYSPDRPFVFSRDWDLTMVNRGRVNNAGFINDQDYRRDDPQPLLAIVGDSFVEAFMVPYADTVQGRLARALETRGRVYSFAASGAPLSQYLVWARLAVRDYGAQALVINVVGNDFDESHIRYVPAPGFWVYAPDTDGELRMRLVELHRGVLRSLVLHSAFARYLFVNLHLKEYANLQWLRDRSSGEEVRVAGYTRADADPTRIHDALAVIDAFFRDLPHYTGLPPDRISFTTDGFRYPDAAEEGRGTYFDQIRKAFHARARGLGYEVIDLDRVFFADFRQSGERFEYPRDGHWNGRAHGIVARAILSSRLLARPPFQNAFEKLSAGNRLKPVPSAPHSSGRELWH